MAEYSLSKKKYDFQQNILLIRLYWSIVEQLNYACLYLHALVMPFRVERSVGAEEIIDRLKDHGVHLADDAEQE